MSESIERVWGIPRATLVELVGSFHGLMERSELPEAWSTLDGLAEDLARRGEFRPRPEAEADPSFKQIIPYVAVESGGAWLTVERLAAGGEERLHHRWSIGIGGHVNPPDASAPEGALRAGLVRELDEELRLPRPPRWSEVELLGLVNDDTNPVGQVHLGVACVWHAPEPVAIRESDRLRGEHRPWSEIDAQNARLETWSRIVLPVLCAEDTVH